MPSDYSPSPDEESDQREKCATRARQDLEAELARSPKNVSLNRRRHQQQWRRDEKPSADRLSTRSAFVAAPPPQLRQAFAAKKAALSDMLSGAPRFFLRDVPAEAQRQAAAAAMWRGGSHGGGGRAAQPIFQRFGAVGGR